METENQQAPPAKNMVDEAKAAAERLEAANREMRNNLEKMEILRAEKVLSGNSEAGQEPPKPQPETPQEYKNRILRGELRDKEGSYY